MSTCNAAKIFILMVVFMFPGAAFAEVECDTDANGYMDIACGGTNSATAANARTALGVAPALGADDNYVTDAEKIVIGNTSGTNTGDQTTVSGNAGTATALAANGGNCSAGQAALGVDASGAAEGCWTPESGAMTWPTVAGIPYWTSGTAWAGAYALDTDIITSVSASDDTIPSAKATKAALDLKLEIADVTTVSTDVETFMGSADQAAMKTNMGIPGLSVTTGPVVVVGNAGGASQITIANGTVNIPAGNIVERDENVTLTYKALGTGSSLASGATVPVVLTIAASDEDTAITAATGKRFFRAPYAFTLTGVRASCKTAPTGANIVIDVNEGTPSVLAAKITIEATEKTSVSATSQPVVGDPTIADDAEMSIDFDTVGSTVAGAGVKVTLYGTRVLP